MIGREYVQRVVRVRAVRLDEHNQDEIRAWLAEFEVPAEPLDTGRAGLVITRRDDSTWWAEVGDWIVVDAAGEGDVVADELFTELYEVAIR